jgi:exosortase
MVKITFLVLLLVAAFWPAFCWMRVRFTDPESFYAHGFLIPFVSGYLALRDRKGLEGVPCLPSLSGLGVFLGALFVHAIAVFFEINFLSGLLFVVVLCGLVSYNCGFGMLRRLAFPLFFLLFMIPLPNAFILGISFYMKIFAANTAGFFMKFLIPLRQSGSLIYLPNGVLTVGAPCSGLKSLIALSALSLLFAHLSGFTVRKKLLFFLCALPVAFTGNIIRIMLLILVYFIYGSEFAMGWFHDFSGFLVFVFALLGLMLLRKVFSYGAQAG